jgi:hypothetical protein
MAAGKSQSVSLCASFYGRREAAASHRRLQKVRLWLREKLRERLDGRLSAADARRSLPALRQVSYLQTLSAFCVSTNQHHSIPFAERRQSILRGTKHPQGANTMPASYSPAGHETITPDNVAGRSSVLMAESL